MKPLDFKPGNCSFDQRTVTTHGIKGAGKRLALPIIVSSLAVQKTEMPSFSISTNALSDMPLSETQLDRTQKVMTVTLEKNIET